MNSEMVILGLMSGTSLDGTDLALCDVRDDGYLLLAARTVEYPDRWRDRLSTIDGQSALEYAKANVELGHYYGRIINEFISDANIRPAAIASHGHTVFHQPQIGLTTQIGDGDAIAAETGLPVVHSFRTLDVALRGQGAPLVPIGDELLFPQYDACLNLGGIANVSYRQGVRRVAFDICPCNMTLNRLASRVGQKYDKDGDIARSGGVNEDLNKSLKHIDYYDCAPPKSLGKEWFLSEFWPKVEAINAPVQDLLHTVVVHVAEEIAEALAGLDVKSLLVTGGGAFNTYLVEQICNHLPSVEVTVPNSDIINYKEAIIFALLGYLRLRNKVNTLSSVTGARCDSIGGNISGLVKCVDVD